MDARVSKRKANLVAMPDEQKERADRSVPVVKFGAASAKGDKKSDQSDAAASTSKPAPSDKAPQIKPLDITVPDEIGRYTIGAKIGSGTCGVVHIALDNVLRREVAIKLSPIGEAHVSTGKVPGAQRAYQTEIVAAGRLSHVNIVTVYDAGQFEELNYLVMESVDGDSLKKYGKGQEPLPVHKALQIIIECCHALDYSHSQGILHRDIKPANIMLADDGAVKLLDFGIAVGLHGDAGLSKQGPTLGTPNYMSPEQIMGRDLTPASDFYSLATVLFELLTSRQLFKARKVKELFRTVVHQVAPVLHEIKPGMPAGLSAVLTKALAKNPAERFQSGKDMANALAPFADRFRIIEERPPAQQLFIKELQGQAFFKTFSDVEIARLLELVSVRTFAKNNMLIQQGDTDRRLFIITEGVVKVTTDNDVLVQVYGAGECIGELGFIHGTTESKFMQAMTPVCVLELSADALSDLPPKVHLHYYRVISDILVERLANEGDTLIDHKL